MDDETRITKALRRRGTTMLCPACSFPMRGPLGAYRLVPDEENTTTLGGRQGIKILVYGCGNCGYVRLHSANVLAQVTGDGDESILGPLEDSVRDASS